MALLPTSPFFVCCFFDGGSDCDDMWKRRVQYWAFFMLERELVYCFLLWKSARRIVAFPVRRRGRHHRVHRAFGAKIFQNMQCSSCHTVEMKTGSGSLFAELRNQKIRPYTDLLLHDMGPGLADKLVEGQAKGSMWRTAPLWGIGYTEKVAGDAAKASYLHDGRARNFTEAILWHAGEADRSRQRFESLTRLDRDAVLAFLKSL